MTALLIPTTATAMAALYVAVLALRADAVAHFDVTPLTVGFAFAAGTAIAGGVLAMIRVRQGSIGPLFALATGALFFAALAIFSIGLLVLPFAIALLVVAVRRVRRASLPAAGRAAVSGAVIGVAAIAYLLALIQPAIAECRPDGATTSSGGFFAAQSRGSGGYSTAGGRSGGWIDEGQTIARFSCQDGKMIDFRREPRPSDFDPGREVPGRP